MNSRIMNTSFLIKGMTCGNCEIKLEAMLKKLKGIVSAKVSLANEKAEITFDEDIVSIADIFAAINKIGYKAELLDNAENTKNEPTKAAFKIDQILGIGIIILALYIIIKHTIGFNFIPEINQSMGYGVLFIVGALTSLHCIAMCGGINLSQCVGYNSAAEDKMSKLKPSFLYNAGRVVSYTIIGGIVGGIGSVVSFSGTAKGIVAVLAGIFMVIMGLNMLNIFPWLKKFNIRMPKYFGQKIYSGKINKGPFIVGLLNGLMPCGPLQAMQLYALGTGSIAAGAASMFFFSLGTVPLMFGLGAVSTILSKKFTGNLMKVSAMLVIILGVGMISRGMSLSGFNTVLAASQNTNAAKIENGIQTVSIELGSNSYAPITVQKGIPVKFIINAKQENINGCNGTIIIPKYGIQKELKAGENIIEFLPEQSGTVPYSCWMGMIKSRITVVDDITQTKGDQAAAQTVPSVISSSGCCGSGAPVKTLADTSTQDIYVAKVEDNLQKVAITVDESGYTPNIIVLQKGIKAKFIFTADKLNQCNGTVVFPEYQGGLDFSKGQTETPELDINEDFGFSCGMGMLNGFVKTVDDIKNIDLEKIRQEAQQYVPSVSSSGCH